MKRRETWISIAAAALLLVLICAFVLCVPRTFFKADGELEIHRVVRNASENEQVEITNDVDLEALKSCLPLMQCRRYRTAFAPYWLGDVQYEVDGVYRGKPFHILLGDSEVNCIYESAEKGGYKICGSDSWLSVMDLLNSDGL